MPDTKKLWIEPEVIALTRGGDGEERLLTFCKGTSGSGEDSFNAGCYTAPSCMLCESISSS